MCTEYLSGGDLFYKLKNQKIINEKDARKIMKQLLEAINYMHTKDIIHRDVKPENILFSNSTDTDIKLIDFGLSENIKCLNKSVKNVGTPFYISPEIIDESHKYGKASDIWSCGVVLYVMLSGHPPFFSSNRNDLY